MANRAARITEADIRRLISGARKADFDVASVTYTQDGAVTLVSRAGEAMHVSRNPCDRLLK